MIEMLVEIVKIAIIIASAAVLSDAECPKPQPGGNWISAPGTCSFDNGTCGYSLGANWVWSDQPYVRRIDEFRNYTVFDLGKGNNTYVAMDGFGTFLNYTNSHFTNTSLASPLLAPGNYCLSFSFTKYGREFLVVDVESLNTTSTIFHDDQFSRSYADEHSINLTMSNPFKIHFRTVTGTNRMIAIHFVKLIENVMSHGSKATPSGLTLESAVVPGCTITSWNITVDMDILKLLYPAESPSNIYLGTNTCTGTMDGRLLRFNYGLDECLSAETVRNGAVVYVNNLYYAEHDPIHPFIIRNNDWTFNIECDVIRHEAMSSHITHDAGHHGATVAAHYDVGMAFFKDPNFQLPIKGPPIHVQVGDTIYVKVYTTASDWTIKMKLDTCYTKPSRNATDDMNFYLIKHGCEVDANTHIMSQSTHESTFLFQDFEYATNREGLDVICNATFCKTSDYTPQCMMACNGNP